MLNTSALRLAVIETLGKGCDRLIHIVLLKFEQIQGE